MQKRNIAQFVKYCMVGVLNTLVCLGTIFICKSLFGINPYVSNAWAIQWACSTRFCGTAGGLFRSHGRYSREAIRFYAGLRTMLPGAAGGGDGAQPVELRRLRVRPSLFCMSGYGVATLLGNVVYTFATLFITD